MLWRSIATFASIESNSITYWRDIDNNITATFSWSAVRVVMEGYGALFEGFLEGKTKVLEKKSAV
jgi:hypothetical protein